MVKAVLKAVALVLDIVMQLGKSLSNQGCVNLLGSHLCQAE